MVYPWSIKITPGSDAPIYQQIQDQIQKIIFTGRAQSGDSLPSVRELAEDLAVNPNTVARAYNDLVSEGILVAQPSRGFFVAPRARVYSQKERRQRLDTAIADFWARVEFLDVSIDEITARLHEKINKKKT